MSDLVRLRIDVDKVRARMSSALGCEMRSEDVARYLRDQGILPLDCGWVAQASAAQYIQSDEILDVEPFVGELPNTDSTAAPWIPPEPVTTDVGMQSITLRELNDAFLIPTFLIGTLREVDLRLKVITRSAVRCGDWREALRHTEFRRLDGIPGKLLLASPTPFFSKGEHIHLYPMNDILMYACKRADRAEWYHTQQTMTLTGLGYFWFALTALVNADVIRLRGHDADRQAYACEALTKLLRWWPQFSKLNSRFSLGLPDGCGVPGQWPFWGHQVFRFCRTIGMNGADCDALSGLDSMTAGRRISAWLEERNC